MHRIKHLFLASARFLFVQFIQPLSSNEDDRRHEFILNILLICSTLLSFVSAVLILIDVARAGAAYDGIPWWIVTLICLVFSGLLVASRLGFFRFSAYVLLLLYSLPVIYMTATWGLDLPQGLLIYALIIIMSSVLISTRFSLIVTSLLLSYLSGLAIAYQAGVWIPDSSWRTTPFAAFDGIIYILTFAAISAVSWLSNREIEKSLNRARRSEAELTQERDSLEIKVIERTAELRRVQAEKLTQLHRFVEFGRLASGLFHDLANPMTAVALNLESLKDQSSTAGQARLHVEQALRAAKGLENFIGAARKQLQTQETKVAFDIAKEIREVVTVLAYKAKKMGVTVDCQVPDARLSFGNSLKFHQVISNLLSNAIDAYTPMNAQPARAGVTITLSELVGFISITVADAGSGIPENQQSRIFEPFFTTKGIESGMGIGLSSTKNIVEKDFHGTISFTSVPGVGTSFTVRIPQTPSPTTT